MLNEEPMDEAEGVAVAQDDLGVPLASLQQASQFPLAMRDGAAMEEDEGVEAAPLQQAASSPHVKRMRTSDEAADARDEDEGGAAARPGGISWQGTSERGQICDNGAGCFPPGYLAALDPKVLIESPQSSLNQPSSHEAVAEVNVKAEAGPAAPGVREELYDAQGEAESAYERTSAALGGELAPTNLETSDSDDHHAGFVTKSIDTLMALKARDSTEPSRNPLLPPSLQIGNLVI